MVPPLLIHGSCLLSRSRHQQRLCWLAWNALILGLPSLVPILHSWLLSRWAGSCPITALPALLPLDYDSSHLMPDAQTQSWPSGHIEEVTAQNGRHSDQPCAVTAS